MNSGPIYLKSCRMDPYFCFHMYHWCLEDDFESLTATSGSTMRWISARRASGLELNCDDFGDRHLSDLVPPVTCKNQHPPHQSELNMQTLACWDKRHSWYLQNNSTSTLTREHFGLIDRQLVCFLSCFLLLLIITPMCDTTTSNESMLCVTWNQLINKFFFFFFSFFCAVQ